MYQIIGDFSAEQYVMLYVTSSGIGQNFITLPLPGFMI
jgi:hypothetical protein